MNGMTPEANKNREAIAKIRGLMNSGKLSVDEAKAQAKPILDKMNARGEKIAKMHGRRHKKFTFGYIMR